MTTAQLSRIELSRRHLTDFTLNTFGKFQITEYHDIYYSILNLFAHGKIRKLIITVPPQHGKSEGSTRRLPAYMLGLNPDLKMAIASYSQPRARKFGREVKRIMSTPEYGAIFPDTRLGTMKDRDTANTADGFEILGHEGGLLLAGRGSALTGEPVDVMINDDLYKDRMEANSPVIRENVIDWYEAVAESRLHNGSQELIVFTRWHEGDLVGYLEKKAKVVRLDSIGQLREIDPSAWYKINFPAIMNTAASDFDPRKENAPLWPDRHSLQRLKEKQDRDDELFGCMYQGDPTPKKGLLYSEFKTYRNLPDYHRRVAYIDTADQGKDFLCCVIAADGLDGKLYVLDVLYTTDKAEVTEPETADILMDNETDYAVFESNAGGRSFARNVRGIIQERGGDTEVDWFHQSKNKEARVLTGANSVRKRVVFPEDWSERWPVFHEHMTRFKKIFTANDHDDAPDTVTGLHEITADETGEIFGGVA